MISQKVKTSNVIVQLHTFTRRSLVYTFCVVGSRRRGIGEYVERLREIKRVPLRLLLHGRS